MLSNTVLSCKVMGKYFLSLYYLTTVSPRIIAPKRVATPLNDGVLKSNQSRWLHSLKSFQYIEYGAVNQ